VAAYDEAHQAALRAPGDPAAARRWEHALAELCDWAGEAVIRPVLDHTADPALAQIQAWAAFTYQGI
jgi:hypothetical protein